MNIFNQVSRCFKTTASNFKFVGINLDKNLTWSYHIKAIKNKTFTAVYALAKVQNLLPSNIKLTIYNSLFRSYVEYGISCWGKNACPDMKK